MGNPAVSPEKYARVRSMIDAGGFNNRQIARECGVCASTVSNIRSGHVPDPGAAPAEPVMTETDSIDGDTRTLSLPRTRICTLDELVAHCRIDLTLWEVERFVANKWEVGAKNARGELVVEPLYQVKAFLRKRPGIEEAERILERLRLKAEKHAPRYPKIRTVPTKSGNVVEISPVDVHHGALIWGAETGGDDYDLKTSVKDYQTAVETLIGRTDDYKPEAALIVLGHDQQNADNRGGSTEALTPQVNDSRYQKVADASCDASIWAIDTCLLRYGRVIVKMVPGNHDRLSTWHLGRVLKAWYRHVAAVEIDNSPNLRKYWEFGVNMLLLTHGDKGKLENYDKTMAAEQPAMWGRTLWREAHTGDKHHRRTIELPGATVRILPSLRPSCIWSAENHYRSIRAAEGYVWNRAEGLVGTATYSILGNRA